MEKLDGMDQEQVDLSQEQETPEEETGVRGTEADEGAPEEQEAAEDTEPGKTKNAANAQMRVAIETANRHNEKLRRQNELLVKAFGEYGINGTPEEIADQVKAQNTGRSVEEIRAAREAEERQSETRIDMERENETLKELLRKEALEKDLAAVKKAYPEVKAASVEELGEEFLRIMATGAVDAATAYGIIQSKQAKSKARKPPVTGKVGKSDTGDGGYYTSEELDTLTMDELMSDPKKYRKAMKSLSKLK